MKSDKGFTLVELIIAIGVIAILAGFALPSYLQWMRTAQYREAAREIAGALRQARGEAVSGNRECRVEFDLSGDRFRIVRGNWAYNSNTWTDIVLAWQDVNAEVDLQGGSAVDGDEDINDENCDLQTGTKYIVFQPNGSLNTESSYTDMHLACIMDTDGIRQLNAGIPSEATGTVLLQR